jgi:hypothetical protein
VLTVLTYLPSKKLSGIRLSRNTITASSERLVKRKQEIYLRGLEGGKDLISLLVRANNGLEDKAKLSDAEFNAQIS